MANNCVLSKWTTPATEFHSARVRGGGDSGSSLLNLGCTRPSPGTSETQILIYRPGMGAGILCSQQVQRDMDAVGPPVIFGGTGVQACQTPSLVTEEKVQDSRSDTQVVCLPRPHCSLVLPAWRRLSTSLLPLGRVIKATGNFFPWFQGRLSFWGKYVHLNSQYSVLDVFLCVAGGAGEESVALPQRNLRLVCLCVSEHVNSVGITANKQVILYFQNKNMPSFSGITTVH